jgi:hypothetical protein
MQTVREKFTNGMEDVVRADKGILDSRTEWALQDLLIDVAAVVAATEPGHRERERPHAQRIWRLPDIFARLANVLNRGISGGSQRS